MLSGDLLPGCAGSRQSPCPRPAWPGGGRRPGSAFDLHSSRDCQQARRWCSSRLRPGTCRAAPQRPARFPRHHAQNVFVCWCTPRHVACNGTPSRRGLAGPLFDHNSRRLPGQRMAAAEAAAGGSRSAARPGADHEDPPSNSTTRPPPRASAHAPPRPLPGAGRSPYQPHECQLAIPPPRGEGEQRTDQICALAIKQLTTAGGPYAGARSSFHGVPDSQQRVARAPAAAPTAARRTPAPPRQTSSRHPLADERTQPENS